MRFRGQGGMAAGKDQAEAVILEGVVLPELLRGRPLRFEVAGDLVLRGVESCASAEGIDGFEAGG